MANNSNKQQQKSKENTKLPRNVQRELIAKITHFLDYGETDTFTITGLPADQRKFLHKYANSIGLKSKSHGVKDKRELHISLRARETLGHRKLLGLSDETRSHFDKSVLHELKEKMLEESIEHCEKARTRYRKGCLLLQLGPRLVPPRPPRTNPQMQRDRAELPIAMYQNAINDVLRTNPVVIIYGQTGSGKTTQVPQYILEEFTRLNKPCRIICTQPRRIATVTVANRVAEERSENLGETVGYQIRLESVVRRTTNLIYTTSGCVLRSIMGDARDFFSKITHLIIDEIHERDKDTDFILIAVKEQLKYNKNLKVLLMSATMDINLLSTYFNDCPVVSVPGQGYNVKIYHLEEILFHTGYRTSLMEKYLRLANIDTPVKAVQAADVHTQANFDLIINEIVEANRRGESTIEFFDQLQYYIENEGVAINLCHSKSGTTPLIAATQCNLPLYVKRFMELNADVNIRDFSGQSALTYAAAFEDGKCLKLLATSQQNNDIQMLEKQTLLSAYAQQFHDDNEVDHYLILSLIEGLYRSKHPGAIMVFLPGYNDIVMQRDLIESTLPAGTYTMFILHGQMESSDQRRALQPQRNRKIILSTNIAQTSITIPDLAYIIDSGKVKMKTHDILTSSSELRSVWISQADARQRSGRAGRTQNGVCYRLYSQERFHQMSQHCIPELMRIPLTEICLYAKSFDPESDVQSFLSRALNPPATLSVQNAIKKLKIIGVFTEDELITELGRHLVDIPVDVQLGKALMYGIFFKCVEPLTTIVAFHSVKDPFILPSDRSLHGAASVQRKSLSGDYFSDQMGILVLYDSYMALGYNWRKKQEFCNKYFLSMPCMDIFCSTRKQIYDVIMNKYSIPTGHRNNYDWNLIRMCLLAGLYPNIALIDRKKMSIKSGTDKYLLLQRSSSLNPPGKKSLKEFASKLPYDWLVFYEKSKLFNNYSINMNTLVPPIMVALQCGREHLVEVEGDDEPQQQQQTNNEDDEPIARRSTLSLDSWIKFAMSENDSDILVTLRSLLEIEFIKFLYLGCSETSEKAVEFVRFILNTEVDECILTFKHI